jgi:ABC-type phosphate/phosphonate transport system substrate-binding protein
MQNLNNQKNKNLIEIRPQGIKALKQLSNSLNNQDFTLDCTGISELTDKELKALFCCIPNGWLKSQEFSNFIDINTMSDTLSKRFIEYADKENQRKDSSWIKINKPVLLISIATIAIAVIGVTFLSQKQPALIPPVVTDSPNLSTLETNKLTIGVLGDSKRYTELKTYLEKTFGDRVQIQFDGSNKTDYQTMKDNIARQKLDIVFTLSPMISIAAKDNGYTWAAKMFADKPPFYQSVLFVKADSRIQSLKDLKPKTIIALGDFNSASSFYMPSYTFYGKKLTVDRGNRGHEITKLVKSGKADVGAAALEAIDGKSEFRIIDKSRDIPGSGVYLSPKLSIQDRQILEKVLLNAPQSAIEPKKANYGAGEEPDYTEFRKITNRVESMLTCVNWSRKQIAFYCPEKETGITGKVINAKPSSINSNQAHLDVKISDRQTSVVIIPMQLINQIPGGGSLLNLKDKQIRLIDVQPSKDSDGKLRIKIDRASQMKLLT